jgi:hypothetical protein
VRFTVMGRLSGGTSMWYLHFRWVFRDDKFTIGKEQAALRPSCACPSDPRSLALSAPCLVFDFGVGPPGNGSGLSAEHADCRPAAKDALDPDAVMVGIPAHVHPGDAKSGSRFYVVQLAEPPEPSAHDAGSRQDVVRCLGSNIQHCFGHAVGRLLRTMCNALQSRSCTSRSHTIAKVCRGLCSGAPFTGLSLIRLEAPSVLTLKYCARAATAR